MAKKVAVVGAGAAGTCAAKHLIEAGFDVTIYEAGSNIGGLWVYQNDNEQAQAYRHLSIITSRRFTHFRDHDFDEQTPRFPTHWDMHRYLESYARRFGVTERIRFKSRVIDVCPVFRPIEDRPNWQVTTQRGGAEEYDAVVVATGHLSEPNNVAGYSNEFGGEYLHSSAYRVADPFVGKRVCIVGMGNSAVDIASDLCTVAERTVIAARSGVLILPKVICGVPFSDIVIPLRRGWIPFKLRARVISALAYIAHGDLTRLGIQKPTKRTHPTLSESLVMNIEYNRIAVKPGIVAIDGKVLAFADGTSDEFDVLIGATGYKVHLPFMSPDILPVVSNHVDLYKRIFVPGWPNLCFVGMLNPLAALNRIFEEQSIVIARYLNDDVALPSGDEMLNDIAHRNHLSAMLYTASPRHEMEEPDFGYVSELHALIRDGALRARYGSRPPPWLRPRWLRSLLAPSKFPWPPARGGVGKTEIAAAGM